MQPIKVTYKLFNAGALISLGAMILIVALQVFTRFFMETTPHWTEEAARIFFIYSVAFGTAIGIKNGDFIKLNLIGKYLSSRSDRLLNIFIDMTTIAFATTLIIHNIKFVKLGMDELSPALEVTMGFVFISITIIGLSIVVFTLENLFHLIKSIHRK
ncbi:MAG: TRAP transporter small permease subunit [Bacteroidales bacterium]